MQREYMFFQGKKYPVIKREIEKRDNYTYRKSVILYEKKNEVLIIEKKADISALLVRYANSLHKLEMGKLNRKNYLILNGIFSALYFSTEEGEIPVSWFKDNLGINEIFKKDLTAIRKAVPKEIFKDTNENYKIFKKISLVQSSTGTNTEEMAIKYKIDKRALKYFKNVVRNFTFLNLGELVRLKSVYSMKLLAFLRMFHGKRSFVKFDWKKACKIMGFDEKLNDKKKFRFLNEAFQELSEYYQVECEIHKDITNPNQFNDKIEFWIFFDTHAEEVSFEKVKWEKEKIENYKKATERGNEILENTFNLHIEDMKKIREYEKKMIKENDFNNWQYQEVCTEFFKDTDKKINSQPFKNNFDSLNLSEREKKCALDVIVTKNGKKLAIPKNGKLTTGCNFAKFAVPENIQEEIALAIETVFRFAAVEDTELEMVTKKQISEMSIYELIKYLTKIGNWKYIGQGGKKTFSVKLFYDVTSGTTNAEMVIEEIKTLFKTEETFEENLKENIEKTLKKEENVETNKEKAENTRTSFSIIGRKHKFELLNEEFKKTQENINSEKASINDLLIQARKSGSKNEVTVKNFENQMFDEIVQCESEYLDWSFKIEEISDLKALPEEHEIFSEYERIIKLYKKYHDFLKNLWDDVLEFFSAPKEEMKLNPKTNYSEAQLDALEIFELVSKEEIKKYEEEKEKLKSS